MKITIAQLNPVVGDITGNRARAEAVLKDVRDTDLVVFPELFLTGYPPRDLLERDGFVQLAARTLEELAGFTKEEEKPGILIGAPYRASDGSLYNAAMLLADGAVQATINKILLPTYDVFDETRYFTPGDTVRAVPFKGERLGISICEDAWNDRQFWEKPRYGRDPVEELAADGATVMINLAASPFFAGKDALRYDIIAAHARRHKVPFIFVNQVGGNDELIFDGTSMALSSDGSLLTGPQGFAELVVTVDTAAAPVTTAYSAQEEVAAIHQALVLGIRDYLGKCGFKQVVIGLSGGIDSAVTCALAAEALGPENVLGVTMPGPYSSSGSITDSEKLAHNLGIGFKNISITGMYEGYVRDLGPHFEGRGEDETEQNIQARIRGNILMALSNKFGRLLLSTGNKSEMAVGYCTLYGDMNGGLAVISDVPKTTVYKLAAHINRDREIIPSATIGKPPSAELKEDQLDADSLPEYDVLDGILDRYIRQRQSLQTIVAAGFKAETVRWVIKAVNLNEYKRRQAPPGLKVTSKAFGMGRRKPIAARYDADIL